MIDSYKIQRHQGLKKSLRNKLEMELCLYLEQRQKINRYISTLLLTKEIKKN